MSSLLTLTLQYLLFNIFILIIGLLGVPLIRSRWPDWWERWIAAPYPDEHESLDDYPRI